MPLTNEELLGQLKTRGFDEGFQRSPLREFIGTLESITSEDVERNGRKWVNAIYNLNELEVLESTEAYTLPIAQISIGISNRKQSAMGVLGDSIDKLVNVDAAGNPLPTEVTGPDGNRIPNPDIKGQGYLIGKRLRWRWTPDHMQWNRTSGKEEPRSQWEIVEVVGETTPVTSPKPTSAQPAAAQVKSTPAASTAKSSTQIALGLLDGKTVQEWNQVVFQNPAVKADGALVTRIIQGAFLQSMEGTGMVSKDANGRYLVDASLM